MVSCSGAAVGAIGAGVGAIGAGVGAGVAVQLVASDPDIKPSRHTQVKLEALGVQMVEAESQPCEPSSHACAVGKCVGARVGGGV